MRHSIRVKNTLLFVGLTVVILLVCWAVNRWYLGSYYMREKQNTIIEAYDHINSSLAAGKSGTDELNLTLQNLSEKFNITIAVIDLEGDTIFSSSGNLSVFSKKLYNYIVGYLPKDSVKLYHTDNYEIIRTYNPQLNAYYMEAWGLFDNMSIFIMSIPLASIEESTSIANRFLAYVGLVAIPLSGLGMYIVTRKVTKPILQLASISEQMSNLNFNVHYEGDSDDEIGVLGKSINLLSNRLEHTISSLKSANNELKKDIEEKNKVDQMRTEFLANVSHELKTPIALIQGYAEGLTEGVNDDEESRRFYCEVIMDEAEKMNKIVKQLLTLNHLESGQDAIQMERFELITLVSGVLSASAILTEQKGISVSFRHPGEVYVWADEFKIEEVLTNYLSNALNHVDGDLRIEINVETFAHVVRVSVFNTGNFIPEEDLDKVWGKFYKVDKARTREYGGSGVGLSIVQAIMESHHQKYGVRNRDDGVEFWFELDSSNSC